MGSIIIDPALASGTFTYHGGGYDEAEVHLEVIRSMQTGQLDPWLWLPSETPPADLSSGRLRRAHLGTSMLTLTAAVGVWRYPGPRHGR